MSRLRHQLDSQLTEGWTLPPGAFSAVPAAAFSRAFRAVYGTTARDYRRASLHAAR